MPPVHGERGIDMKLFRKRFSIYDADKHVGYLHRNGFYKLQRNYWRKSPKKGGSE